MLTFTLSNILSEKRCQLHLVFLRRFLSASVSIFKTYVVFFVYLYIIKCLLIVYLVYWLINMSVCDREDIRVTYACKCVYRRRAWSDIDPVYWSIAILYFHRSRTYDTRRYSIIICAMKCLFYSHMNEY